MTVVWIIDVRVDAALEDIPEERRLRRRTADGFHQEHIHKATGTRSQYLLSSLLATL